MNDKYLYSLDVYMTNLPKKNLFHTCLEEVCKKIGTTYELYDYDKVNRFIYGGDGEILDIYKAAGIWFVQAVEALNIKMPIPTYAAVLNQFDEGCILLDFAVGYILKYIDIEGTSLRDAIIRHPLCSDVNKLWRWYDYANIDNIQKMGMPCFYSSDRYTPLSNIYCDSLQLIELIDDDLNFKENNIINFLFTFDPVNDTEKTAVIKHKLIFSVYFYIFVTYPRFMTEWAKSVKNGVVYEIHPICGYE